MNSLVAAGDLEKLLQMEREEPVYRFRPAFGRMLYGSFRGFAVVVLLLAASFVVPGLPLPERVKSVQPLLVLPAWLAFGAWWLQYHFTNYTLTNQRLIIKMGILVRNTDEIELYRVKDLKSNASILNRLAGIGSILITTTEVQGGIFALDNIRQPEEVRELMRELTESVRKKRGVREADMFVHQ